MTSLIGITITSIWGPPERQWTVSSMKPTACFTRLRILKVAYRNHTDTTTFIAQFVSQPLNLFCDSARHGRLQIFFNHTDIDIVCQSGTLNGIDIAANGVILPTSRGRTRYITIIFASNRLQNSGRVQTRSSDWPYIPLYHLGPTLHWNTYNSDVVLDSNRSPRKHPHRTRWDLAFYSKCVMRIHFRFPPPTTVEGACVFNGVLV